MRSILQSETRPTACRSSGGLLCRRLVLPWFRVLSLLAVILAAVGGGFGRVAANTPVVLPALPDDSLVPEVVPFPLPGDSWVAWMQREWLRPEVTGPLAESELIGPGQEPAALRRGRELLRGGAERLGEERLWAVAASALRSSERAAAAAEVGEARLRRGAAAAAARAFRRALETFPQHSEQWTLRFWEAAALAEEGERERAATLLALAADAPQLRAELGGPGGERAAAARLFALRWAGWLEALEMNLPAARHHWRRALGMAAADSRLADSLALSIAETHFAEVAWESVAVQLERPGGRRDASPRWDLLEGRACYELGRFARADSLLARVTDGVDVPPGWQDEARIVRGWIALQSGEAQRALTFYAQVSGERLEDIPPARYGAALAYIRDGDCAAAEEILAPAPPVAPDDPLHHLWAYALAFARFHLARYDDALVGLEAFRGRALADSLGRAAWSLRGDSYFRTARMEEASAAYTRAAAMLPEIPESLQRRQALAALGAARWGAAARLLGDLLLKFPGTPRAPEYAFWRGEAFYRLGRLPEAREHYGRAARLGADPVHCAYALGWCEYRAGNYAVALTHFDRAAPRCGRCRLGGDIALRRGNCLFNLGRIEEAAEAFAAAERLAAADTVDALEREAAFRWAWSLMRLEDYRGARRHFAGIHERNPDDSLAARALYWEGQALFREQDFTAALERFARLLDHPAAGDTLRARALLAGGDAAFNADRVDEAIEWYRRLLEAPGADRVVRRSAHESLFECRQLRGEWEAAQLILQDLVVQFPEAIAGGDRHLQLGDGFFDQRRYADALTTYGDFLEYARPDDPRMEEARYRMARCREELGQTRQAALAFATLGERQGFRYRSPALLRAGVLFLRTGEPRLALQALERRLALDLTPGEAALTRAYLAQAYDELGEALAARNEWEKVARAGSAVAESLRAIGSVHLARSAFEARQWEAAMTAYAAADSLGLPHRIHRALYWAGEAAFRLGEVERARGFLEAFLRRGERAPLWEATARMRLAECYEAGQQWSAAREQYERVIAMPLEMESILVEARERLAAMESEAAAGGGEAREEERAAEPEPAGPAGAAGSEQAEPSAREPHTAKPKAGESDEVEEHGQNESIP
ncbi:MAG: tetratricopeptide repeat protein [Candidatus Eisenbacteria sp.]|nr:tetratricopeptide repeat protein [Candidatus Eisenbacteria bacterium]